MLTSRSRLALHRYPVRLSATRTSLMSTWKSLGRMVSNGIFSFRKTGRTRTNASTSPTCQTDLQRSAFHGESGDRQVTMSNGKSNCNRALPSILASISKPSPENPAAPHDRSSVIHRRAGFPTRHGHSLRRVTSLRYRFAGGHYGLGTSQNSPVDFVAAFWPEGPRQESPGQSGATPWDQGDQEKRKP